MRAADVPVAHELNDEADLVRGERARLGGQQGGNTASGNSRNVAGRGLGAMALSREESRCQRKR